MDIQAIKKYVSSELVKQEILLTKKKDLLNTLNNLTEEIKIIEEAQTVVQDTARRTQEQIKFNLEAIVNVALQSIFPNQYRFEIIFEVKRNKTEARIVLVDIATEEELDPTYSNGIGLQETLGLMLRIALLVISKQRKVLILDEPLVSLSKDLSPKLYKTLRELSTSLGIQLIIISHDVNMMEIADKRFIVSKTGGLLDIKEELME